MNTGGRRRLVTSLSSFSLYFLTAKQNGCWLRLVLLQASRGHATHGVGLCVEKAELELIDSLIDGCPVDLPSHIPS